METDDPVLEAWRAGDDEAFMRALAESSYRNAFRPRDEDDADIHPESFRASILRVQDEQDRVIAAIRVGVDAAPWYRRLWMRPAFWFATRRATRSPR